MMHKHWAKVPDDGRHSFVITDGRHPTECGEPSDGHTYVALTREPREDDTFDGKRLRRGQSPQPDREDALRELVNRLVDDRLRDLKIID